MSPHLKATWPLKNNEMVKQKQNNNMQECNIN